MDERLREAGKVRFTAAHPAWPYYELSRRLLDSAGALAEFPDRLAAALLLVREAALAGLRARVLRSDPAALGAVEPASEANLWDKFAATPTGAELLGHWAQSERALARDALLGGRPLEVARLGKQTQRARWRVLSRLAWGLVRELEREATSLAWVRTVRRLRFAAVALLLLAVALGAAKWMIGSWPRGEHNLALGKPVTASSFYQDEPYPTSRLVDGNREAIGFHTDYQDNPTVTIDLLGLETVHRVVVYNRKDYRERAVPLIIETSSDGTNYQQFARRDEVFSLWEAKAGPVRARYVRLKVPTHVCFHLNEVEVY